LSELDTDELARRMRAGDDAAGRAFEARLRTRLEAFCRGYVGDADAAGDLAAEVIARLLAQEEAPARVEPWLFRVARNLCLDARREHGLRAGEPSSSELAASLTGPLTRLARVDERRALERRLERLSEEERELLRLRYVDELGRRAIAELLGWPATRVKSRLFEALRKLRS